MARRIRDEATTDWDDTIAVERFEGKGGRFIRGEGRVLGPGRVAVGEHEVTAGRGIVVATGTRPSVPPVPGLAEAGYWTNRDVVRAEDLPPTLLVMGGGAIGLELAQALSRFGVEVTVIEALDRLAPGDEPEAGALLADVFGGEGIAVRTGAEVTEVHRTGDRTTVSLADGTTLVGAELLVATGRKADLAAVGLGAVGVDESQRWVPVDDHLRVTDGVWAVGDITGKGAFTHMAVYQAPIAAADILGEPHEPASYGAVPRVTFTDPEIGAVGLTQAQAEAAGIRVRTGTASVPSTARGWIHKAGNEGIIKLVEDADRGVLVGATAMGPSGGEVIGMLTLAVHDDVPVHRLGSMIYAYPTFHRGIGDALRDLSG